VTFNTRREAKSGGKVAIKRVMPRQNEAINEIWMCDKGRFAYHFTADANRLVQPLVRKEGKHAAASWTESLQTVSKAFSAAKENSVILAGGRLSNEDLFNLKQLAGGLGGEALLYTHMGGGELTTSFGVSVGTNFSDMGKETTILVVASDLYNEAPLWFLRIKQAAERGATLIIASARETKLERYSKFAVRYSYGDEVETISGLPKKDKIGGDYRSGESGGSLWLGRPRTGRFFGGRGCLCRIGQKPHRQAEQRSDRRLAPCQ
jgi:NADH-quinone oxidoreductase subunit G